MDPQNPGDTSHLTDEELVKLSLENTQGLARDARQELIRRVTPWLYQFARERALPSDASVYLVQETLLRIWRQLATAAPTFDQTGSFMSWVRRLAHSQATDFHQKRYAHLSPKEKPAMLELLESEYRLGEAPRAIEHMLSVVERELGSQARRILELKIEGLPSEEIAAQLGTQPSVLDRSLEGTRQLLRDFLGSTERGGDEMARRPGPPTYGKRFVGNTNTTEVHDLDKEQTGPNECQIGEIINAGHAVTFTPDTLDQAHRQGYDNCAYCIGGSRR